MSAQTTTVTLPASIADALLRSRGWTVEPIYSTAAGERANAYVFPGGTLRSQGGAFGTDYLWQRDEALTTLLEQEPEAHRHEQDRRRKLHADLQEAEDVADGEAVDAFNMLDAAVREYLGTPEAE